MKMEDKMNNIYNKYLKKTVSFSLTLCLPLIFPLLISAHGQKKASVIIPSSTMKLFSSKKSITKDSSGLAAVNVTASRYVHVVAMGDNSSPMDIAQGGIKSKGSLTPGTSITLTAKVIATVRITKIQGSVSLFLNVIIDGNSFLISRKDVTSTGTYVLDINKYFSIEPNHEYEASCIISIDQPRNDHVIAATGKIIDIKWVFK